MILIAESDCFGFDRNYLPEIDEKPSYVALHVQDLLICNSHNRNNWLSVMEILIKHFLIYISLLSGLQSTQFQAHRPFLTAFFQPVTKAWNHFMGTTRLHYSIIKEAVL